MNSTGLKKIAKYILILFLIVSCQERKMEKFMTRLWVIDKFAVNDTVYGKNSFDLNILLLKEDSEGTVPAFYDEGVYDNSAYWHVYKSTNGKNVDMLEIWGAENKFFNQHFRILMDEQKPILRIRLISDSITLYCSVPNDDVPDL